MLLAIRLFGKRYKNARESEVRAVRRLFGVRGVHFRAYAGIARERPYRGER
jgi:hypothetical protein